MSRFARVLWVVGLAAAAVVPFVGGVHAVYVAMSILVLTVFATSYNILLGYAGLVSFAHAAFYGLGAYTVALLWLHFGLSPLIGLVLAPVVAGIGAYIMGFVALRATRLYFALLTLALGQLIYLVIFQWRSVTHGDDGIHGMELPAFLDPVVTRYYFVLAATVVALAAMYVAMHSPFGATLRAIRENRERVGFLGVKVKRYELAAFTLGGVFAGWAGATYAIYDRQVFPLLSFWTTSADPIFVTLIGGVNSFAGPTVGAIVYGLLHDEITRRFAYWGFVLGVVLLAIIIFMPGGIVEGVRKLLAGFAPHRRSGDDGGGSLTEPTALDPTEDLSDVTTTEELS